MNLSNPSAENNPPRPPANDVIRWVTRWMVDNRGTVTIELALVLPLLLFLSLLLVQTMLLMAANHFVRYAAYTAARVAVVQIPQDATGGGGLGPNRLMTDRDDPKFNAVRRAAVFALWPISGRVTDGMSPDAEFASSLQRYYESFGRNAPNWVERLADDKLRYAEANTRLNLMHVDVRHAREVRFEEMAAEQYYHFGTKAPVTARVEHDFGLTVPIMAALFAEGRLDPQRSGAYYTRIAAHCTLNNEGIPDTLPTPPTLPRIP